MDWLKLNHRFLEQIANSMIVKPFFVISGTEFGRGSSDASMSIYMGL